MKFAYLIEPPFNFVNSAGYVTGCDVELARFITRSLGFKEFELIETEFAELLPGLADGRWQMTTGLFGTEERRKMAEFSRPIWALPDGFLVAKDNPIGIDGYRSLASAPKARLAVVRDQLQHRSAVDFGVGEDRISLFDTYTEAAESVLERTTDAYASVARAHSGFIAQNPEWPVDLVVVPSTEKPAAFGSFAFALDNAGLRQEVDAALSDFLGTTEHREMVAAFGFSNAEVALVAEQRG